VVERSPEKPKIANSAEFLINFIPQNLAKCLLTEADKITHGDHPRLRDVGTQHFAPDSLGENCVRKLAGVRAFLLRGEIMTRGITSRGKGKLHSRRANSYAPLTAQQFS